ncbi:TPA: hypothetical protein PXJ37_002463 [Yersinia enterocolitica]|nr:hypothetical protein [Yersinia enterocolitica]HDM8324537.1 hypothetical protein [Yersinia enterocolitica]HEF7274254.1 hypothetical protein [Yersinia enterocolitica]HEK5866521.1 hypothetical protein [Yersinia enterocolitica]HEK6331040.1 hypothetical protein [Yersinia enterocolitica]
MSGKQNEVLDEILKALVIIENKTRIKRDEFDKYPSEDLMHILLKELTPLQESYLKENIIGYEYLSEDEEIKWFCDAWLYYFYD